VSASTTKSSQKGPCSSHENGLDLSTVNDAAEAMLADLELSPLTKATYRHGLNALIRYLHIARNNYDAADALAPCPISWVDEETLAGLARWLREAYPDPRARPGEDLGPTRTARTYMVAARRLMNWLDLRNRLPEGVSYDRMARRIDAGRGHRRQGYTQRRVDPEVMRVLTHYMRQKLPTRGARRLVILRNRVLMALLYDTGTRISEALALAREDVLDGRAQKVRLTRTKNGKPRTVFLSEETRRLIAEYVRERDHVDARDSVYAPLFASHGRGRAGTGASARSKAVPNALHLAAITPAHAWRIVKDAAKAEGLYDNTSPHSLRHRRAQDLLDEGMPLEWVAALLGHEHPDTTRVVYAWETDEERLADMVATFGRKPSEAAPSE
jgi:site-specific recombinase XerD